MIVNIQCPHCKAKGYIDTHWITKQDDKIQCYHCSNDYPAHLWEKVDTNIDDREKVIFT